MTKEQKHKVEALSKQQIEILSKLADIVNIKNREKVKTPQEAYALIAEVIGLSLKVRALEIQKHIIMSQCIPKHKKGCSIIGEINEEKIIR